MDSLNVVCVFFSLQEKITNLEICIKERKDYIETMKNYLIKGDKVEKIYSYSEEEYKEHGLYKGYHKVEKTVPYKKPVLLKVSIAGKKRKFDEI